MKCYIYRIEKQIFIQCEFMPQRHNPIQKISRNCMTSVTAKRIIREPINKPAAR